MLTDIPVSKCVVMYQSIPSPPIPYPPSKSPPYWAFDNLAIPGVGHLPLK